MNYGLYLSAAGAISNMHRQNVIANNLANMNTIGFKADHVDVRERLPERQESPDAWSDPKWMLERLGGGVYVNPTRVSMKQGSIQSTGGDFDIAIEGNALLVVGNRGDEPRFTRDGRLALNGRQELVLASSGLPVQSEAGRPIELDPTLTVDIDESGAIRQDGQIVAQLALTAVPDERVLRKEGDSLLRYADGVDPARPPRAEVTGRIVHRHVEASAVDPILAMNSMISAAKAAQGNLKMMQYHDQILGRTFNTFARVS